MIPNIKDVLHCETANVLFCNHEEREKFIKSKYGNTIKCAAALAVHNIVRINPNFFRDALIRPYQQLNLEVIGFGLHSTVIRQGDYAIKLLRLSKNMTIPEKLEEIQSLRTGQEIVLKYMSDFALEATYSIIQHPLQEEEQIIAAKQPYLADYKPIQVYDIETMNSFSNRTKAKFIKFAECSLNMLEKTGYIPDIYGVNNFGLVNNQESLLLIDTEPVLSNKINRHRLSLESLNNIINNVKIDNPE